MSTKKKYIVGNPRGIPEGVPVLQFDETYWYEGDEFRPPKRMSQEALSRRIEQGYLVEV